MFQLTHTDSNSSARAGVLCTDHGSLHTPMFMPVGTLGTVKALPFDTLEQVVDAEIILGNTYHLYLRPGLEIIRSAGGLHQFIDWQRPMLTDSGGYQVYSLSHRRKIDEQGVTFASHIDGSKHTFTPESVMDIQRVIGADIIMAFDECTPYPCEYAYAKESMEMTHRWLKRCVQHFDHTDPIYGHTQVLAPIVQGSVYEDLRRQSAEFIAEQDRPINAIGGLSVGEPAEEMYAMTEVVCSILPLDKPRYLMGVGTPANIISCIARGIDLFDCVMPTRNARHGMLFTAEGIINIKNAKWASDFSAIDSHSISPYSRRHTKAYLRHLIHNKEILGYQIATTHNIAFYLWLVREARRQIVSGNFDSWSRRLLTKLENRL